MKIYISIALAASLLLFAGYSMALAPEKRDTSKDVIIHLYGNDYPVVVKTMEDGPMTWDSIKSYIPPEILKKDNPKKSIAELKDALYEHKKAPAKLYTEGIDDLTKKLALAHPEIVAKQPNLDLYVAEHFVGDDAQSLITLMPEYANQIKEVDKYSKIFASILLLEENIKFIDGLNLKNNKDYYGDSKNQKPKE